MIQDYFNTLASVMLFAEGTAPDFEATYTEQTSFYGLIDKQSSSRIWQENGSAVRIDSLFYCDSSTVITEKDRLKIGTDYYSIYSIKNPNEMGRHLEIMLQKVNK